MSVIVRRQLTRRGIGGRPSRAAFVVSVLCAVGAWSAALGLAGPAAAALPANCTVTGGAATCSYASTGGEQTFLVPDGVQSISVKAVGAPGGTSDSGTNPGGFGATVTGTLSVSPGQTLYVEVGGLATDGAGCNFHQVCVGGFNGGGSAVPAGAGGGGASDIRTLPSADPGSLASRLLVAGGGGAGADDGGDCHGGAGGSAGLPGQEGDSCGVPGGLGGDPGTASAGGAGASPDGGSGSLGTGGSSGTGGAGGGGLYGGGGGADDSLGSGSDAGGGGGGGGSNLVPPGGRALVPTAGTPSVTISFGVPVVQLSSALTFATQALTTLSSPQTVTITNAGLAPLSIDGVTFGGTDPSDFLMTDNGCMGPIAPGGAGSADRNGSDRQRRGRGPDDRRAYRDGRQPPTRPDRPHRTDRPHRRHRRDRCHGRHRRDRSRGTDRRDGRHGRDGQPRSNRRDRRDRRDRSAGSRGQLGREPDEHIEAARADEQQPNLHDQGHERREDKARDLHAHLYLSRERERRTAQRRSRPRDGDRARAPGDDRHGPRRRPHDPPHRPAPEAGALQHLGL